MCGVRRLVLPQTETRWQAQVLALAKQLGWMHYHTHDSRRSPAGFPDLVLVRGSRLVIAELKTDCGTLTPEQVTWLTALRTCAGEVYIWRPRNWDDIALVLRGVPAQTQASAPRFCAWCEPVGYAPWASSRVCATHLAQERARVAASAPNA